MSLCCPGDGGSFHIYSVRSVRLCQLVLLCHARDFRVTGQNRARETCPTQGRIVNRSLVPAAVLRINDYGRKNCLTYAELWSQGSGEPSGDQQLGSVSDDDGFGRAASGLGADSAADCDCVVAFVESEGVALVPDSYRGPVFH